MATRRLIELGRARWSGLAELAAGSHAASPSTLRPRAGHDFFSHRHAKLLRLITPRTGRKTRSTHRNRGGATAVGRREVLPAAAGALLDGITSGVRALGGLSPRDRLSVLTRSSPHGNTSIEATLHLRVVGWSFNVFVTAWIGLGGLGMTIARNFAAGLAGLDRRFTTHLVCTDRMAVEADPRSLGFDTVTFLPPDPAERKRLLPRIWSESMLRTTSTLCWVTTFCPS